MGIPAEAALLILHLDDHALMQQVLAVGQLQRVGPEDLVALSGVHAEVFDLGKIDGAETALIDLVEREVEDVLHEDVVHVQVVVQRIFGLGAEGSRDAALDGLYLLG